MDDGVSTESNQVAPEYTDHPLVTIDNVRFN